MWKKIKTKFNSLNMTLQFYIIVIESMIIIAAVFYSCLYPVIVYNNTQYIYENLKNDVDYIDNENLDLNTKYAFAFIIIKDNVITKSNNLSTLVLSEDLQEFVINDLPYGQNYSFTKFKDEKNDDMKNYVCTVKINDIKYCIITNESLNEHLYIYKDDVYLIFFAALIFFIFFLLVSRWINKLSSSVLKLNSYLLKYSNDYKDAPTSTSEINSLFKNFNDYRKTLLKKDDEKQVLFQNISHELKTPITTIKMYSEAIQDGIYDEDNIQNATNIIIKETNNLLEKVNKIMQINKLSYLESVNKGVTIIDKVSISDILFEVVNNYNVIHPEIKFNVNLISIDYRGTKDVWKNVFENIFDNNIRNKATTIEITLNDKYLIIENNGEKIPQDFMPNLFEPFKKGQNGNFGLGLNIIKKSLELYNYSIKIENSKIGVLYLITDNK